MWIATKQTKIKKSGKSNQEIKIIIKKTIILCLYRSSLPEVFCEKKVFLKISQYSQESTCVEEHLRTANSICMSLLCTFRGENDQSKFVVNE